MMTGPAVPIAVKGNPGTLEADVVHLETHNHQHAFRPSPALAAAFNAACSIDHLHRTSTLR